MRKALHVSLLLIIVSIILSLTSCSDDGGGPTNPGGTVGPTVTWDPPEQNVFRFVYSGGTLTCMKTEMGFDVSGGSGDVELIVTLMKRGDGGSYRQLDTEVATFHVEDGKHCDLGASFGANICRTLQCPRRYYQILWSSPNAQSTETWNLQWTQRWPTSVLVTWLE